MFAASLLALALVPSAFAAVSITAPVASTSWAAGQQQTITWMDDGKTPTLAQFGAAVVSIYAGSQTQQTKLQEIANVDVSTTGSITFTPDPSVGANSNAYFIRIDSVNLKDSANPQFPAQSFSAKFTLTGMTGTFNSTVQAQIDGASSAAAGSSAGSASSTPASGSSAAATSSKAASSSASRTSSGSATASATGAASDNGASGIATSFGLVSGIAAFVSALVF